MRPRGGVEKAARRGAAPSGAGGREGALEEEKEPKREVQLEKPEEGWLGEEARARVAVWS